MGKRVPSARRHRAFGPRPTSPDISGSPSIIYDKQKNISGNVERILERKTAEIQYVGDLALITAKGKRFLVGAGEKAQGTRRQIKEACLAPVDF